MRVIANDELKVSESRIAELEVKLAEAEKDARRYRWLRNSGGDLAWRTLKFNLPGSSEIDDAIDAAIAAGGGGERN